jgi:CheY-like chemotaxis protein
MSNAVTSMVKILVIDDAANFRRLLDLVLHEQGYNMFFADNGRSGLELYRQEHPDVIILDLNMPGMDGIAVLTSIRSVDLKQLVIVMTGDTTPEKERQVRALGVNEFILKGQSLQCLIDALNRLLTRNHSDGGLVA